MFDHVIDGLFVGEKEVVADLGRERPNWKLQRHFQAATNIRRAQKVLGEFNNVGGEAVERIVPRVDRPDNFIQRAGRGAGRAKNLPQILRGLLWPFQLVNHRLAEHRDPG